MKYQYTYTGENPIDIPTLGIRDIKKGDTVESDEPLYSSFLVEKTQTEATSTDKKGE